MGRHGAAHIPTRDLRRSYIRLREAYEQLLRDHLELKHHAPGPPAIAPGGPLSFALPAATGHLAVGAEPLGVDAACELVRSSGLLTAPGLEA
ncbi:hypothetical protein ACFV16_22385 [Streptomyces massasporeus]|uniref:hypothetical protein n=1 Tax=Streptomyces massasporeus TaxID=67324 RepID=UPI00369EEBEF